MRLLETADLGRLVHWLTETTLAELLTRDLSRENVPRDARAPVLEEANPVG